MKPGDRVIRLYSPGHSFLTGWRLQGIPGTVVRVRRRRIRISIRLDNREKLVNVDPENVIFLEDNRGLNDGAHRLH